MPKRKREFKHQVTQTFDAAVETYDQHALLQKEVAQVLAHLIAEQHAKEKRGAKKILEIGCGTGFLTTPLQEIFSDSLYCVTDRSLQMVRKCLSKQEKPLCGVVMDGEYMSVYGTWDWIASSLVVQWFGDLRKALMNYSQAASNTAFTTLVEGTFQEWIHICQDLGIAVNANAFMKAADLNHLCREVFPSHQMIIRPHREKFESILDFLSGLKKIGAQTPLLFHVLPKASLKKIIHKAPKPFEITYQIAYILASSKK